MKTTKISATDLRIQTRDIIERARFKGERFVVQTFGKPVVVILGIEEYYSLEQLAKNGKIEPGEKTFLRSARQKPQR